MLPILLQYLEQHDIKPVAFFSDPYWEAVEVIPCWFVTKNWPAKFPTDKPKWEGPTNLDAVVQEWENAPIYDLYENSSGAFSEEEITLFKHHQTAMEEYWKKYEAWKRYHGLILMYKWILFMQDSMNPEVDLLSMDDCDDYEIPEWPWPIL